MLISLALLAVAPKAPADSLAAGFRNPPASARPHTWWHWMNGNVTAEGITADLEAMKEVGIGGAQMFTVDQNIPAGHAPYMGAKWRELTTHAIKEAGRLGIELCIHNCAGWSSSGGPWIKPEDAMQVLAWSETKVAGPIHTVQTLPQPQAPRVVSKVPYYRDIAVFAFRTPETAPDRTGDFLARTAVERGDGLRPDLAKESAGKVGEVLNITDRMGPDGRLDWEAPAGNWTVLRMGHVPTGKDNHPAPPEGDGLEVDKLSRQALEKHWDGMMAKVIGDAGQLAGKVLNNALIDSYEVGDQNWTPKFREDFRRLRGYDPLPSLPATAGYVVKDRETTERFLWDFRRTIADLYATNYFGHFGELCHRAGMKFSTEPYGNGGFDNIQSGSTADIPMGEFWTAGWAMESVKLAASVGHVYGRPVIGAESFTADEGSGRWLEEPFGMKSMGDRAFTEGVNRYIFHRYAAQPWLDVAPGMTMGPWGSHLDRTQTWWTEAQEWMRYIARCQYLLQKGRFVADVAYYYGEDAPADLPARPNLRPAIPAGYDYDGCDAAAVRSMKVKDGRVVLPSGMSYSVLVLPESEFMTPAMARKIRDLVADGATVVGPKPKHTPSLSGFPATESETRKVADELWGDLESGQRTFGKGRIISRVPLATVLSGLNISPDFESKPQSLGASTLYLHRQIDGADVYFVSNPSYRPIKTSLTFRSEGRVPELWHPDTGDMETVPAYRNQKDRTSFDLSLPAAGSTFVVFRNPAPKDHLVQFGPKPSPDEEDAIRAIKIDRAFYGAPDGRGTDVTARVRDMVAAGQIDIPATNALFGDPVYLVAKRLTIEYTFKGKDQKVDVAENETASLVDPDNGGAPAYTARGLGNGQVELTTWKAGAYTYQTAAGLKKEITIAEPPPSLDLSQDWQVEFQPDRGAPASAAFDRLVSWPERPESGIRYFSGTATYRRDFDLPPSFRSGSDLQHAPRPTQAIRLDLGTVKNFATVSINGMKVATLWKPPFVVDVTPWVRPGRNRLEVKVTNLWPNRLIGDENLPPEATFDGNHMNAWPSWLQPGKARIAADRPPTGRITFATWHYFDKGAPLLPSGLIGPVRLESAQVRTISTK